VLLLGVSSLKTAKSDALPKLCYEDFVEKKSL